MGYLLTNMIVSHLAAIVTQLMDVLDGKKPNKLVSNYIVDVVSV